MESFHFFKLKLLECAEENKNRATGRKFNIRETFMRDWAGVTLSV
jgi:hypothetical protein